MEYEKCFEYLFTPKPDKFFHPLIAWLGTPSEATIHKEGDQSKVLAQTLVPFGLLLLKINHTTVQYSIGLLPLSTFEKDLMVHVKWQLG